MLLIAYVDLMINHIVSYLLDFAALLSNYYGWAISFWVVLIVCLMGITNFATVLHAEMSQR